MRGARSRLKLPVSNLEVHVPPAPGRYQSATRAQWSCQSVRMKLPALLLTTLLIAVGAVPADAASRLTVRGAGYGHGVGMSQYGALGFAQHGAGYREILRHYYTGTDISRLEGASGVRVLLQGGAGARFDGATGVVGGRALTPATTYAVTPAA